MTHVLGSVVLKEDVKLNIGKNSFAISISKGPSGIYLFSLQNGNYADNQKIISE